MDYLYSRSTGGFYLAEIHGDSVPADAVPVTEEQHAALMDPPAGYQIGPNEEGFPVLLESPAQAPLVPQKVSRFQGREAMWQTPFGGATLFEAAEALINHPDTPPMYLRAWVDMQEFRRDSEMLGAIATQLGLTQAQIDALFILAASIKS